MLLELLPAELRGHLSLGEGVSTPFHRHRQLSFNFKKGVTSSVAFDLAKPWNTILKARKVTIRQLDVYALCDAPEWKKQMRVQIARALGVTETEIKQEGDKLTPDWAAGALWLLRGAEEESIGHWDRNRGWKWNMVAVHVFAPSLDQATLDLAMTEA